MCSTDSTTSPASRRRLRGADGRQLRRSLLGAVAVDQVAALELGGRRKRLVAAVDGQVAARREEAAGGPVAGQGRVAGDPDHGALALHVGDGAQQLAGVGVAGGGEDRVARAALDDPPRVHDRHAVSELGHHGQVVADVDGGHLVAVAQVADGLEHAGLGGDVKARRRLVADDHVRAAGERHRDGHALLLAAGQLMGVAAQEVVGVGQRHLLQRLANARLLILRARLGSVGLEHLRQLPADAQRRVQRGAGILGDVGHGPATQPAQLARPPSPPAAARR